MIDKILESEKSKEKHIIYANDNYETVGTLLKLRSPVLFIGLFLGLGISFVTSNFEKVISQNVEVAFFLPFIVYLASAVGAQTEAIYSRNLKTGKAKFSKYFHKEFSLGFIFGIIFGVLSGIISFLWIKKEMLSLSVALGSFLAIFLAPIIGLLTTHAFQFIRKDPAVGSGPIATVIQDMFTIFVYGIVCSLILL